MGINEEFPIGSIVIHKKTKKRYKIRQRWDYTFSPFHLFELQCLDGGKRPFRQWGYYDLVDKFVLEERGKDGR